MAYHIRLLSFSEILDRSLRVLVDNFALLAGIAAVFYTPYNVLQALQHSFASVMVSGVIGPVVGALFTCAAAKVYVDQPTTMTNVFREVRPILLSYFGTYLLFMVLLIIAFLGLIVPELYFAVCWSLFAPVMIVERRFGMAALRRSRQLVRGVWWQTAALTLVPVLFLQMPLVLVVRTMRASFPLLGSALGAGVETIAFAYLRTVVVIYYFDRRCRTEDFDLRLLAQRIRSESGTEIAPAPEASTAA